MAQKQPRQTKKERKESAQVDKLQQMAKNNPILLKVLEKLNETDMEFRRIYPVITAISLHATAIGNILIEKGIMTQEDLDDQISKLIKEKKEELPKK